MASHQWDSKPRPPEWHNSALTSVLWSLLNQTCHFFQELLRIALEEEEKYNDGFILDTIERGGSVKVSA